MRSRSARERYPLHQSPLYKMRGKGQFERVLGIRWDAIDELSDPTNYRVWRNKKGREIQQPVTSALAAVHVRIARLLSRIELPDYLFSRKGRSYVDNARHHIGAVSLVKTDIHKFYPSITREMLYRLFVYDFQCAADIAHRLADICCYRRMHLPTGSALSARLAFLATRPMFDEIAKLASAKECRMTAYVDDITVSGFKANKQLLGEIRKTVRRYGLKTTEGKSMTFAPAAAKAVTGVIVAGNALRLPNARHLRIWETRRAMAGATGQIRDRLAESLRGRVQEACQILGGK